MLKELVFIVTVVVRIKCRTRGLGSSWNERGQGEKAAVGIKKDQRISCMKKKMKDSRQQ